MVLCIIEKMPFLISKWPVSRFARLGSFYTCSRSVWFLFSRQILGSSKKALNIWSQRDLTIFGRINIIKTSALSKLVFICIVMNTRKDFSREINKTPFDFIWNHKPAQKKRQLLSLSKKQLVLQYNYTCQINLLLICLQY